MSTKTGTPGFDIDGKTYTFDVGDPRAPDDPNYPVPTDHGDIHVDKNEPPTKDIGRVTKKTLADYLGKKTQLNYVAIDGTLPVDAAGFPVDTSIVGVNNTTPVIPSPDHTAKNSKWFTQGKKTLTGTVDTSPDLKSVWQKGGDVKFTPPNLKLTKLKKGKSVADDRTFVTGNELLPQVDPAAAPPVVPLGTLAPYTAGVLANNRFTADANFTARGANFDLHSPKYGTISMNRMAQVGISLSIRGGHEIRSTSNASPSSAGTEAAAILPSFAQLGAERINFSILEANDVLNNLTNDEVPDANIINMADLSYGTMNNTLDQYDGMSALGMVALSAALTAAIGILFDGLGLILGLAKGTPEPRKNPDGRFILGRSTVTKHQATSGIGALLSLDIASLLGIRFTITPLKEAVSAGVHAFFGIDDDAPPIVGALVSAITKPADSPGYNSVVARAIIRSIVIIIDKIKKAFSGNLIAAIKKILALIDVIRTSKLISAINVFASLGDALKTDNPAETIPGRDEEPKRKSRIDSIGNDDPIATFAKNRLNAPDGTPSLKLAWASNRAASLYLLPNSIAGIQPVAQTLGGFQSGLGLQEEQTRSFYRLLSDDEAKTNGNRIPHGDAGESDDIATLKKIESVLDAEYVPFYFHDIRTNEVIAFHAFLASLTDDYAASYESTEGFGRVEPVKIYKGTHRKIGMSFFVAATSTTDFNDMWVKINKLVTLVYPQYTEGRRLTDPTAKYNFTQPFSQMMGASPMIRIRLGNLLTTNYSRFALARLFGATLPEAQFGKGALKLDGSKAKDAQKKIEDKIKSMAGTWILVPGGVLDAKTDDGLSVGGGGGNKDKAPNWTINGDAAYIPCKITGKDPDNDWIIFVKPQVPDSVFLKDIGITDSKKQGEWISYIKKQYDNSDDPKHRIIGGEYVVALGQLLPTGKTQKEIFDELFASENEAVKDLSEFLDIEKNALVKSFRSAGGKGLAGFIDSMNFDWYSQVTWDTDPGNKAPKMCKVTISFSPIHDISPGLDSQGYNRAPIYPIGFFAHGPDSDKGAK